MSLESLKTRLDAARTRHAELLKEYAKEENLGVKPELTSIKAALKATREALATAGDNAEFIDASKKRIAELEEHEKVAIELDKLQTEIVIMERTGQPVQYRPGGATLPTSSM